jgi:hypothetical protein
VLLSPLAYGIRRADAEPHVEVLDAGEAIAVDR